MIHDCISTVGVQINEHMLKVLIQVIIPDVILYLFDPVFSWEDVKLNMN